MATQTANTPAKHAKPIPHIVEPPLVGSLPEHTKDRLNLYLHVAQQCGDVGSFHLGPFRVIFFNAPESSSSRNAGTTCHFRVSTRSTNHT